MKLLLILLLSLFTSQIFAASTTASIGGTLKVYQPVTISSVVNMNFPTQYAQQLPADLYSEGPAGVSGATPGNYGSFNITGSAGGWIEVTISQTMPMAHSGAQPNITSALFYSLTGAAPWTSTLTAFLTAFPGSGLGQTSMTVTLRGKLSTGTNIFAGQYNGTINVSVNSYM